MPTLQHYRRALAICREGGTEEHPYCQAFWGDNVCGTPCCVHGHACLLAGEPIKELGNAITLGVEILCLQTMGSVVCAMPDDILDKTTPEEIVSCLQRAGWCDADIVHALHCAGRLSILKRVSWSDDRIANAAGWSRPKRYRWR
jgi:hypothetical protein